MTASAAPRATAPLVLADALPGQRVREVALVVGGACFVGLAAQLSFPLPFTPVPVTGQTLAVLLAGAALGWQRALPSMLLYLLVGMAGVPWFADGASGTAAPSFGYILGFVAAATLVGRLAGAGADRTPVRTVALMVLGNAVIYLFGVPWLAASLDVSLAQAVSLGVVPFLLGDAVKVAIAAGLLPAAWRLVDRTSR
jgi:biotin transport system substrate-specific component